MQNRGLYTSRKSIWSSPTLDSCVFVWRSYALVGGDSLVSKIRSDLIKVYGDTIQCFPAAKRELTCLDSVLCACWWHCKRAVSLWPSWRCCFTHTAAGGWCSACHTVHISRSRKWWFGWQGDGGFWSDSHNPWAWSGFRNQYCWRSRLFSVQRRGWGGVAWFLLRVMLIVNVCWCCSR